MVGLSSGINNLQSSIYSGSNYCDSQKESTMIPCIEVVLKDILYNTDQPVVEGMSFMLTKKNNTKHDKQRTNKHDFTNSKTSRKINNQTDALQATSILG